MIKFLIICCIIYIIFRYIVPFIFPLLLGSYVNKKMSEMRNNQQSYKNNKREGEVTIDYIPENKKQYPNNSGDYVDYEEIK
jgi:hypothetical protein